MSSSVHFRFKSARQFETLSFEGDFLKVADLKVAIVERKKLNFGEGFDLEISDASTADVFNDESALVQKNTSVIVRRIPGLKQGGILSHQEMAAKNERYAEKQGTKSHQRTLPSSTHNPAVPKTIEGSDEAERIASLVMQSNVQYDQFPPPTRGRHTNRPNGRGRPGGFGAGRNPHGAPSFQASGHAGTAYPDRAPKPSSNYVCHRCNRPGHWIDQCPTNGDPAYDRIKVRAPTGIPRSMLRQVDAPESGTGLQDSSGHFVTLQPNEEEFARQTVGLRLSQAAASAGDSKPGEKPDVNAGDAKPDPNRVSGTTSEHGTQGNVGEEKNLQARASPQQKPNKHAPGSQLTDNGSSEKPDEKTKRDTAASTTNANSATVHPSRPGRVSEDGKEQNDMNNLKVHGKKPTSLPRKGQAPPPPQPGIPHILPVPPIPPGFPSLGMPPIPSGVPPFPPHLFMAMAMAKGQNGQASHGPPGMLPDMPIPFTSPPPSTSDVKRKGVVSEAQQPVSKKEKMMSMADSRDVDGKILRPKAEQTRHKWSPNDAKDRGDGSSRGRDKTYPPPENVDFASHSKHLPSSSRAKRLVKGTVHDPENASSHEHEAEGRGDRFSDSRNITNAPRPNNRRVSHRSSSPPSLPVRNISDKRRSSPSRRERRHRADRDFSPLSPKRRTPENENGDHHFRRSRRETRNMSNSPYEHREDIPRNDYGSIRDFQGRRRAQSPSLRGNHGMNGAMSLDISDYRHRSPERRSRRSPARHPQGNSSRSLYGRESPDARSRQARPTERRLRSVTPPRSGRQNSRNRDDMYEKHYRPLDRGEKDREFQSARNADDPLHKKLEDRPTRKGAESERDDPAVHEHMRNASLYADEGGKRQRCMVTDGSSPGSGNESRAYYAAATDNRKKRELSARPDSEYRVIKKQRRQRGDRLPSYRDDIRDRRISVHDRLGRPADSRRRKEQRKSVHDRLG